MLLFMVSKMVLKYTKIENKNSLTTYWYITHFVGYYNIIFASDDLKFNKIKSIFHTKFTFGSTVKQIWGEITWIAMKLFS